MVCVVDLNEGVRFNFAKNELKQKLWIKVLLMHTNFGINHIAQVLEVSPELLTDVVNGNRFLSQEHADRLGELFLIAVSD